MPRFGATTKKQQSLPTVMLIGLPAELGEACKKKLVPIPVLRVSHLAAASQRVAVTRPLVAVVTSDESEAAFLAFVDLARGVGCEVVRIGELGPPDEVPHRLEEMTVYLARKRSGEFAAIR